MRGDVALFCYSLFSLILLDAFYVQAVCNDRLAYIPTRATKKSAGYDLYCKEDVFIPAWNRTLVGTGLRFFFNGGLYARLAPRSGLAVKGIDIGAGVIDADYRGEVKVLMINSTDTQIVLSAGTRICQVIFEKIASPTCYFVPYDRPIPKEFETERGEKGFGGCSGLY